MKLVLDFAQAAVVKYALECLKEDIESCPSVKRDAQAVVNGLLPLRHLSEERQQTVQDVVQEILAML